MTFKKPQHSTKGDAGAFFDLPKGMHLQVVGARTHNLKDIDVTIVHNAINVITGPSGSGKSSLAYDTIFSEASRRFAENLSMDARQYFSQLPRADFDTIEGIRPAIALKQGAAFATERSTLGTLTEIYDYLRVLYSKLGVASCSDCNAYIKSLSASEITDTILAWPEGTRIELLALRGQVTQQSCSELIDELRKEGVIRVVVGEHEYRIDEDVEIQIGSSEEDSESLFVVFDRMRLKEGIRARLSDSVESCLKLSGNSIHVLKVEDDNKKHGNKKEQFVFYQNFSCDICGIELPKFSPQLFSFNHQTGACSRCDGLGIVEGATCDQCLGQRLNKASTMIEVAGKSIADLSSISLVELGEHLESLRNSFDTEPAKIAEPLLKNIIAKISTLIEAGVGYLSLERRAKTLSRGELQRVKLCSQLSAGLSGVLYILDEPSAGLHESDCEKVIVLLAKLADAGNTLLVVEHEPAIIRAADYIIELGQGAGEQGGSLVSYAAKKEFLKQSDSLTANFLNGKTKVFSRKEKREIKEQKLSLKSVSVNNLNNVDIDFPLYALTSVTGVSGSGKSSLLLEGLLPAVLQAVKGQEIQNPSWASLKGFKEIQDVQEVDVSLISRSPRSNPSTFLGIFSKIRELFAMTSEARVRGFSGSRFSFNVKGGRCEKCQGAGIVKVQMQFMSDVFVRCELCGGDRYNEETLSMKYRGKNISDVLSMTVVEAATFFHKVPSISKKLMTLVEVGLGYLTLGQPAPTLSGGESQRLRLANALGVRRGTNTLFILDEPTSGLHMSDISVLLKVLHRLVDEGNTVIAITHNADFVSSSDWLIEMGPKAGSLGGKVLSEKRPA